MLKKKKKRKTSLYPLAVISSQNLIYLLTRFRGFAVFKKASAAARLQFLQKGRRCFSKGLPSVSPLNANATCFTFFLFFVMMSVAPSKTTFRMSA